MLNATVGYATLALSLIASTLSQTLDAAEWTPCLKESFENISRIKTFDIAFTGPISDGKSRVVFDGEKWLIESDKEILKTVLSSKAHEELRSGNSYASVAGDFSNANSKYMYPINDVYFWVGLKSKTPLTFADLQNKERWDATIAALQSKGEDTLDGKPCEVYLLTNESLDVTIWFSRPDHGLPIQFHVENNKLKQPIKTTVTKVATFDDNVSLPQSISIDGPYGKKQCELSVEESSINSKIDPDTFNIVRPTKAVKTP